MNQSLNHIAQAQRIAPLMVKYMKKKLTRAEKEELDEWLGANPKREQLFNEMTDPVRIKKAMEILSTPD